MQRSRLPTSTNAVKRKLVAVEMNLLLTDFIDLILQLANRIINQPLQRIFLINLINQLKKLLLNVVISQPWRICFERTSYWISRHSTALQSPSLKSGCYM